MFHFKSETHRLIFFERLEGKNVIIEENTASSSQQYKFLNGAIIPYIFYQNRSWKDFKECRTALLEEYCPKYYYTSVGGETTFKRETTANRSKVWMNTLIEKIVRWMEEQGYEIPDTEDYQRYIDSAPLEEYPPLNRIKWNYLQSTKS